MNLLGGLSLGEECLLAKLASATILAVLFPILGGCKNYILKGYGGFLALKAFRGDE